MMVVFCCVVLTLTLFAVQLFSDGFCLDCVFCAACDEASPPIRRTEISPLTGKEAAPTAWTHQQVVLEAGAIHFSSTPV